MAPAAGNLTPGSSCLCKIALSPQDEARIIQSDILCVIENETVKKRKEQIKREKEEAKQDALNDQDAEEEV